MLAQAIHQSAGAGIGTFLGCLIVLFAMKRAGRDIALLRGSVLYTALVAGMGAWMVVALTRAIFG